MVAFLARWMEAGLAPTKKDWDLGPDWVEAMVQGSRAWRKGGGLVARWVEAMAVECPARKTARGLVPVWSPQESRHGVRPSRPSQPRAWGARLKHLERWPIPAGRAAGLLQAWGVQWAPGLVAWRAT